MASTHRDLLRDLTRALSAFLDPDEARAEAHLWMEEGFGLDRSALVARGLDPAPPGAADQVEAWLVRRRTGEPWAYLRGWSRFRGRRFTVTPATLIPRPETELLVEAALEVGHRLGVDRAVDVGTGSGIVALSLALETPWTVTAVDLSPGALAVARANAAALEARVTFLEGSLLDPVADPVGLVVANLPYVDPADAPTLQRELAFEPDLALYAGDSGLALTTELLRQARRRGAPACLLEIGAGQGGELCRRALGAGWAKAMVHQDVAGHDRILVALA